MGLIRRLGGGALAVLIPVGLAVILALVSLVLLERDGRIGASLVRKPAGDVARIYSSVPLDEYVSVVHGVEMALEEAGSRAGQYRIEYIPLSDAKEPGGKWDAGVELANARRAAEDPLAVAYIGTYNSGAAKISIPVLNRVGMAMISPGNTYPGLTKPETGAANEPWVYYPLGPASRNYFRVVPADDIQGAAGADYVQHVGVKNVFIIDDTELYGVGVADVFERRAREKGIRVAGRDSLFPAADIPALAQKIIDSKADGVYFGGIAQNRPADLLSALVRQGFKGVFLGADGIATDTFADKAMPALSNRVRVFATSLGLPAGRLQGPGAEWYRRYKARYPEDRNVDFAPFGYEAGRAVLAAIARAGDLRTPSGGLDRDKVRRLVAQTGSSDLNGPAILGEWRFDANGDTSLRTISVQTLGGGSAGWRYLGPGPTGE